MRDENRDYIPTTPRAWERDISPEAEYRRAKAWREDCEAQLAKARKDEDDARVRMEKERAA